MASGNTQASYQSGVLAVTPEQAIQEIIFQHRYGTRDYGNGEKGRATVFLWGEPGVGKSSAPLEAARRLSLKGILVSCSDLPDTTPMRGIPWTFKDEDGTMRMIWLTPKEMPNVARDGAEGILVLDELPSADDSIRKGGQQLAHFPRELGGTKLPPGWTVVVTGNRPSDGVIMSQPMTTEISRACHMLISPRQDYPAFVESWINLAERSRIHPVIIQAVRFYDRDSTLVGANSKSGAGSSNFLWNPDFVTMVNNGNPFACPRTVAQCGEVLMNAEDAKVSLTNDLIAHEVHLYLGLSAAVRMREFLEVRDKMPPLHEVIRQGKSCRLGDDVQLHLLTAYNCLDKIEFDKDDRPNIQHIANIRILYEQWTVSVQGVFERILMDAVQASAGNPRYIRVFMALAKEKSCRWLLEGIKTHQKLEQGEMDRMLTQVGTEIA